MHVFQIVFSVLSLIRVSAPKPGNQGVKLYIQHLFNINIYTNDSIRIVVKLNYIIVVYMKD